MSCTSSPTTPLSRPLKALLSTNWRHETCSFFWAKNHKTFYLTNIRNREYPYYSKEFIRHYEEYKYVILPSLNLLKKRNRHWINMSGKKLSIVTIPIHSSSFFPSTLTNQANSLPVLLLPRTTVTSMSAKSDKIIFVLFYLIFFNRT